MIYYMKNINQIKAIEEYNQEYLKLYHSKKVRLFRNIDRIKNNSLKDSMRLIKKKIFAKVGDIRIKKNVIMNKKEPFYYSFGSPIENTKVAVYTCITNGYDNPKKPLYLGTDTDYYLYTDLPEYKDEIWKYKKIDCVGFEKEANRYYKFHPNIFDSEYEFAIYIDGNVKIISDVTMLCSIARHSKTGIAMHKHHARDCVYEEGKACKYYKRGNSKNIQEQLELMKKEEFPERFGLFEATIIVYDLKNPNSRKITEEWWNRYYNSNTKRDQIFFPYIIWKMGLKINDVGILGNNLWNNPKFIIYGHD